MQSYQNGISNIESTLAQLHDETVKMLLLLNDKEKYVITHRYNLDNSKRQTLEEIGTHYDVTRERIRQIERTALNKLKRNVDNFSISAINNFATEIIKNNGGVIEQDTLIANILNNSDTFSKYELFLILSLDKRFEFIPNTINYLPFFKLNNVESAVIENYCLSAKELLKRETKSYNAKDLAKLLLINNSNASITPELVTASFNVCRFFKVVDEVIGLTEWRDINPRTLRDKIYYILRKKQKPAHFVDICNEIITNNFDRKNVNLQAVHNELIRHEEFILIGRGIYALKEWGFKSGTVADVIKEILNDHDSLSEDEIVSEVLKQRDVKPITIILNLKNKEEFVRVGRKQYSMKNKAELR